MTRALILWLWLSVAGLAERIDVRQFGPCGTGIADSRATIQAAVAFAQAQSGRGEILLPAGFYVISDKIVISRSGIYLYGEGNDEDSGTQIIQSTPGKNGIEFQVAATKHSITYCGIHRLSIVGAEVGINLVLQPNQWSDEINMSEVHVRYCKVGLHADHWSNSTVRDSLFNSCEVGWKAGGNCNAIAAIGVWIGGHSDTCIVITGTGSQRFSGGSGRAEMGNAPRLLKIEANGECTFDSVTVESILGGAGVNAAIEIKVNGRFLCNRLKINAGGGSGATLPIVRADRANVVLNDTLPSGYTGRPALLDRTINTVARVLPANPLEEDASIPRYAAAVNIFWDGTFAALLTSYVASDSMVPEEWLTTAYPAGEWYLGVQLDVFSLTPPHATKRLQCHRKDDGTYEWREL